MTHRFLADCRQRFRYELPNYVPAAINANLLCATSRPQLCLPLSSTAASVSYFLVRGAVLRLMRLCLLIKQLAPVRTLFSPRLTAFIFPDWLTYAIQAADLGRHAISLASDIPQQRLI